MREPARVQAAIELLDAIIEAARTQSAPADRLIVEYFRTRRYAGSKDRRAIRELAYDAIRACGPVPESGRAAMLRVVQERPHMAELFDGSRHAPAPIAACEEAAEGGIAPHWLVERLAALDIAGNEASALLDRAPLDLRVNTLKASREEITLPVAGEPLAAANALRMPPGTSVEQWPAYQDGLIEIQDHGSQWACQAVSAKPGETVIDLCAGAGGKTLALAAQMNNYGRLIACDTDRRRLGRLKARAQRAGASIIETLSLDPGKEAEMLVGFARNADAVLVDAPCSSTGTWRRNPEARWRLTPDFLDRTVELQARLLDVASELVKTGGRLIYATCSLLDEEGAGQIERFLNRHSGWKAQELDVPVGQRRGLGVRLTPAHDGTDGFFIAQLARA